MKQLTMLGGLSQTETVAPYAAGDILQTKPFGRVVVTHVDRDANDLQVCVAVRLDNGSSVVVLEREIQYRSRG